GALGAALGDVRRGLAGPVPAHLRDSSYRGSRRIGHGGGYRYSHEAPTGVLAQQYPPDAVVGRDYYRPSSHGAERGLGERVARLRGIIRGGADAGPDPDDGAGAEPNPDDGAGAE